MGRYVRAERFPLTGRQGSWYVGAALALLLLAWAGATPRAAAPATLFFSEYIEGSSNNKALEIYNGTGTAVDLAAGGYNVQMFFNGGTSATTTINLAGTVADGSVFVLAQSSAVAAVLAQADQTSGASWYNGDDAVVLRQGTTVLDVIGQVGADPGTAWGSGDTTTVDHTLRRKPMFCGDPDGSNDFDPAAEWDGLAADTFDGLGSHTVDCDAADAAPTISSVTPSGGAADVSWDATITVTFSEPVTVTGAWFSLWCTASGAHTGAVTGGPTAFTINPDVDFTAGESCTIAISPANVADRDTIDPPDQLAAAFSATFTTTTLDPCTTAYTPIPAIQGRGAATAVTGVVTTRGVVVGDYESPVNGSSHMRGFYIQDAAGDGDAATSDGIFVFRPGLDTLQVGQVVRVTGTAGEFQGQTQIGSVTSVTTCGTGSVTPVSVTLPWPSADYAERFEGMLVQLPQSLSVTEHFQLARFGQVVVSANGLLEQPTDVYRPGPEAAALQAANDLNRLIIDDGSNIENPDPIVFGREGAPLSASNTLRAGDTATGIVGVMTYTWAGNSASGNAWRVRPLGALNGSATFVAVNDRPLRAPDATGNLRVASMNLLNFFNTFNAPGVTCTGGVAGPAMECRGADDAIEFGRQWPKTVAAITGTGADIVGALEIENDGYGPDSALQFLVDRLNDATSPGAYAFVDVDARTGQVDAMGSDAIKVSLLYKTGRVVPVGNTAALNTVAFVNGGDTAPRNRPAVAQAFEVVASGARLVVSVNHLKSKGSACDAPDANDGQDNCSQVRRAAANALTAWLATDPTGTGDAGVLIVGDLNSYSMEDPIVDMAAAGYVNLRPEFDGGHSYVFDGQWGSLDHALASASLRPQVTAVQDWLINADEPAALDYNANFKSPGQVSSLYAADQFRMSDHNPLLIDLDLDSELNAPATITGSGELVLDHPGGTARVDTGSALSFSLNVKSRKRAARDRLTATVRSTRNGTVHRFQITASAITSVVSDHGTGTATIVATGRLDEVTRRSKTRAIDHRVTIRLTVDDNGEPGRHLDTLGMSVWRGNGTLWLSSTLEDGETVVAPISRGNIQIR